MILYTVGYGHWPTTQRMVQLIQVLRTASVTTLVDVRQSPCSSNLQPISNYGPKPWNLQLHGSGLEAELQSAGIGYYWIGELGNPQKHDPAMAILRSHVASADARWPVNRGLQLLQQLVQRDGEVCCLLCACGEYAQCHRKLIAETLRDRFVGGQLTIQHLP